MKEMNEWTTLELVEFLNSYNRVYKTSPEQTYAYQDLYVNVFAEMYDRIPMMALLY